MKQTRPSFRTNTVEIRLHSAESQPPAPPSSGPSAQKSTADREMEMRKRQQETQKGIHGKQKEQVAAAEGEEHADKLAAICRPSSPENRSPCAMTRRTLFHGRRTTGTGNRQHAPAHSIQLQRLTRSCTVQRAVTHLRLPRPLFHHFAFSCALVRTSPSGSAISGR